MTRKFNYAQGDKFGRLTLTCDSYISKINGKSRRVADCICDCGTVLKSIRTDTLKQGTERSCGCYKIEAVKERSTKHGMSSTFEYKCWKGLKDRCINTNSKAFDKWYSQVSVYEAWISNFEEFYSYMGPCPDGMNSIDRILTSKGYEPGNVRWSCPAQQLRNRSKMKNNTSGYTGVTRRENKSGVSWVAFSNREDGSGWSKSFSEVKYGECAKQLAVEYRAHMIDFLRDSGVDYGQEHGL